MQPTISLPRDAPLVSVVIPTTKRHDLVQRAIGSVVSQTMSDFEIIVVIDGPNPDTVDVLRQLSDTRLTLLVNDTSRGAGGARNRGAEAARGRWIAFLDDDDEWLPDKLERQLALAGDRDVLMTCRSRVVTPSGTYIWPRQLFDGSLSVDDYLFDRRSLFRGAAFFGTSSYLLPRSVFVRAPFGNTSHNEDTTMLLRVTKQEGVPMVMAPDVLVVVHAEASASSIGSSYDWRAMLAWADATRSLLTKRAYSGFCLIYLGSQAAKRRAYRAFPLLLWRALSRGAPTALQVLTYLAFWIVPADLRQRLRASMTGVSSDNAAIARPR